MIQKMSKQDALQDFWEKHVLDQWQYDLLLIDERYTQQKDRIEQGLCAAFDAVCTQAATQQEQGEKGEVHSLYFSLLRTGIMENRASYRLDAYDQNWFLDPIECATVWTADFLFDPLFHRIAELEEKKRAYARLVTSMDIEQIKQIEAKKYHLLTVEFIKSQVPALRETSGYMRMKKASSFTLLVGEYRDESEIIFEEKQGGDA